MPSIVYVGNADSRDITVLALAADGTLSPVATTPVPGMTQPGPSLPLAVSPDKRLLIAGIRTEPYAAATFSIDAATGKLTAIGSGPLADSMAYLSTDRTGRHLFAASYGGSKLSVNPIGADGVVGTPSQVLPSAPNAHCIVVDPSNRYVLTASLGGGLIHQHVFDPTTGTLTPNTPAAREIEAGAGPRHLVFSPDGRFLYLLGELDASVRVFPWDAATGTLGEQLQAVSAAPDEFDGKLWSADIHVTPDGRFLYASERGSSTLAAFRIDGETGRLTPLGSVPTAKQPRGFAIDPASRFLLAAGQLSDSIVSYAIDPATGRLTELAETPVGKNPNWVEIVALP